MGILCPLPRDRSCWLFPRTSAECAGLRNCDRSGCTPKQAARRPWLLYRQRVAFGEVSLVPIGVDGRDGAGFVEPGNLFCSEVPADGVKILPKLFLVAGAENDG